MTPADDTRWMDAALAYARQGVGETRPNPSVAALVVKDGVLLGRGRTAPGGRPHAERVALDAAGATARGATMIVTLEPCARRSQRVDAVSCTDAIIAAGIARVVIGADDPSSFAGGEGAARLRAAGIAVETGVSAAAARRLNLGHILRITDHRPLVSLKMAQTADGFAGTPTGGPIMITGQVSFRHTHLARAEADAIMVGVGTVLGDDPQLSCRLPGLEHRSPERIVLDGRLRTPLTAKVVTTARQISTRIFTREGADAGRLAALRAAGVDVTEVPADSGTGCALRVVLSALAASGITRLMVEGGPTLAEALAEADLIDDFTLMTGPASVGAGCVALRPGLRRWLAAAGVTHTDSTLWGEDRVEIFERDR